MSGLSILVRAAEGTTEAAVDLETVATEFSGLKVPIINMVMMGLSTVLLFVAVGFCIYYLVDRTDNWGFGLIAGVAGYLLFCSFLFALIQIGLSYLPLTKDYVNNPDNARQYGAIMAVVSVLLNCVGILLALKYVSSQMMKRGQTMTIGTPLAIGAGTLVAIMLTGGVLRNTVSLILASVGVNQMGFDEAVTTMAENLINNGQYTIEQVDLARAEATDYLHSFMMQPSFTWLLSGFVYYILFGLINACFAVILFGKMNERLENKWVLAAVGMMILYMIPHALTSYLVISNWAAVLIDLAVTAAAVYLTFRLVKEYMPDELKSLTYSHRKNRNKKKDDDKPKKMPHIVMPDK